MCLMGVLGDLSGPGEDAPHTPNPARSQEPQNTLVLRHAGKKDKKPLTLVLKMF